VAMRPVREACTKVGETAHVAPLSLLQEMPGRKSQATSKDRCTRATSSRPRRAARHSNLGEAKFE
jgi:hypothetical protein